MIDIVLGAAAIGVTVEWVAPWIVEQQLRLEDYLERREQEQIETQVEDHLLNNGYYELPRVIVIPMGEPEPKIKQRIIIPGDANVSED